MALLRNGGKGGEQRLKSWKQIASFFGADERTVKRWESTRGLPVRRIPGKTKATVYADIAELESWMRGHGSAAEETPPGPRPRRRAAIVAGVAALAAACAAVATSQAGWLDRAAAARHQPPQRAVDLYLAGTYNWEKRTPDSLERARDLFGRAIVEDPAYAEAYAGLANTYLLLREYSGMPDSEAYLRAREAAERALALDPNLADAHAALAFVTFFWTRDWPRGLAGFERATRLNPGSADAWHWYGTALFHAGRFDEAMRALDEAQRHEPASRSILADKALISYHAGRRTEAVAQLRQLAASEPEFYSPHFYLAQVEIADGDPAAAAADARAAARIKGDPEALAATGRAEAAFRRGGRAAMLRAMLADEETRRRAGRGSDYQLAELHALLGEKGTALGFLAASGRAGESRYVAIRVDPCFRGLRGDTRFRQLAADVERPPPGRA